MVKINLTADNYELFRYWRFSTSGCFNKNLFSMKIITAFLKYMFSLMVYFGLTQSTLATSVPLQLDNPQWQALKYKNIRANRVSQIKGGLQIEIDSSASPLIFVFDEPQTIRDISVMGKMGRLPIIPKGVQQGDKGADDFPFRLGLVLEGEKNLNFGQKLIATEWVKILFALAPSGTGIDHVKFLNLANPGYIGWQQREQAGGKGLFTETIVNQVKPEENFDLNYTLPMPESVIAIWISADGDDTKSNFSLSVNSISFN
jgi:hypothetical protein